MDGDRRDTKKLQHMIDDYEVRDRLAAAAPTARSTVYYPIYCDTVCARCTRSALSNKRHGLGPHRADVEADDVGRDEDDVDQQQDHHKVPAHPDGEVGVPQVPQQVLHTDEERWNTCGDRC